LIFSIASFVDICNVSGVAVAVAQISTDIGLDLSQIVWIITSYSLTFASVLLFAGRLADLFPAQIIFEAGFLALGIISLVTSFVTSNKFGFLILRGIGGICGAMSEWPCLARSPKISRVLSSPLTACTLLTLRSHPVRLPLARAHVPQPQGAAGEAGPPRHVRRDR
jgi:MFS family permease